MLKLKRLEIVGFKSFADRTRLEFSEGTVAIVGPNGCGKSNLSDAMSWVLGEQSPRLLRGERMTDLIFNGTGNRLPTSLAEVSLTLVDPEAEEAPEGPLRAAPAEGNITSISAQPTIPGQTSGASRPSHVTVTRRLFRSGESEYLIDGQIARLRDIQDLFMGTGLGPESYAIIEQGRIGQILSSKPSDRRLILEEAAGISKFKARKRAAELKLESARGNLSRINDILLEVSKQVNSLKRQASKARRYQELHAEWLTQQRLLLASRIAGLESARRERAEEMEALDAAQREVQARLAALEQEQKSISAQSERLEVDSENLQLAVAEAARERQRVESQIERAIQEIAHLEARTTETEAEANHLEGETKSLEVAADERAMARQALALELAAAQENATRLTQEQERLGHALSECEEALASARRELLAALGKSAELGNQSSQAEEMALALGREAARMAAERDASGEDRRQMTLAFENLTQDLLRNRQEHGEFSESLERVEAALEGAQAEESARRSALETLRQEMSAVRARQQTLESTLSRHAYTSDGVRRLLSRDIGENGHRFRPLGLLSDFVEVSPGYEEVVEEFLKAELECVVVEAHAEAQSAIALLREESAGRSMFFVTRTGPSDHTNGDSDPASRDAGVIAPVRELIRFEPRLGLNGDLPLPSLARAYLVEDASAAERLAKVYPEHHFLTANGEHYHHRLVAGGKGASAGPLALRRDYRELTRRAAELESTIAEAEKSLADAVERAVNLKQELESARGLKLDAEKKTLVADEKVRHARDAADHAAERMALVERELARLAREGESVRARREELRVELERAGEERSRLDGEISALEVKRGGLRDAFDRGASESAKALAHSSALEERARGLDAEFQRFESQLDTMRSRCEQSRRQLDAWAARREELHNEAGLARQRLQIHEDEQARAQKNLTRLSDELKQARARRDQLAPDLDLARADLESLRAKRSEAEVAKARLDADCEYSGRECLETLAVEPAALLAECAPASRLAGEALAAAEEQARALKTKIENLGPLNMMALEELRDAEERYTFLETQRQDLLASIEDTTKVIREIDLTCRQQFMEAFRRINEFFAESFKTLFGGGVGQLRLTDENDPESGLDIVAQPPGKRLQNVLLLSGGEKALAAMALLIALFRFAPSPFCILDEVDAPLDESNIVRFTQLINRLSLHTQFIIITHNKRTMEIARSIYGVTMEEPGVSKLVSVKLEEAEPMALSA